MIPTNPLTMLGNIQRCWLFTYKTPVAEARALLPPELEPITRRDCAFWNVVFCRIAGMRPAPLPAFLGLSYWHVAYRLYVRFHPAAGEPVEGLYILRSDCSNRLIAALGNLVTDFNFHTARIRCLDAGDTVDLAVETGDAPALATVCQTRPARLPPHSVFTSVDEAAAFLNYQPFGLSVPRPGEVNVVEIVRDETAWKSRVVHVESAYWAFFEGQPVKPEICYQVEPIAYRWNRGRNYRARGGG